MISKKKIQELRKLVYPRAKHEVIKNFEYGTSLGLTEEQTDKINHLFLNVYGHGRTPDTRHHHFLQSIVHYGKFEDDIWEDCKNTDRISDECISDLYEIAPQLFEPDLVKEWYIKCDILDEEPRRPYQEELK